MTSKDTGHQKRCGRGFIQRVGELFSANVYISCMAYTRTPNIPLIEGKFLLAMGRVFRMIEVQDNRGRGLGIAGNEVVDERLGKPVEVRAGHLMFEPGKGRSTRQVLGRIERYAFHTQLKHGIIPEAVRIIAVRIAGGNLVDTLGEEVPERMVNIRRVALVTHGGSQALCQADLTVDTP